jgi:2-C-methyl-D-erythritol 2,4-cyclodiphosphate synthase
MNTRIGFGYDIHRFDDSSTLNKKLVLGGIVFANEPSVVANSDGDVVIHAIIDALLGASCMGDIGDWFSEDSQEFKDIDSTLLLKKVLKEVRSLNFIVENVDLTVVAQEPKLKKTKSDIKAKLEDIIEADVNVKATSPEKVGALGNKEAIACFALVNLSKL